MQSLVVMRVGWALSDISFLCELHDLCVFVMRDSTVPGASGMGINVGKRKRSEFRAGDMARLADEYLRRTGFDPSLTLEDFADQHDVSSDELRFYLPEPDVEFGNSILLWHGTTRSRAESIIRSGFRAEKAMDKRRGRGQIFFSPTVRIARRYARTKARTEGDRPAVIMCSIDLNRYSNFERQTAEVYVFNHEYIGREVIKGVDGLPKRRFSKLEGQRHTGVDSTNVALAFNSGRAGIAYWVNSYLELDNDHRIHEDHEAVGKIEQWLDDQVKRGRFGEVPDDEILEQVRKRLPQYF
jgi:hypothetical protein